MPYFNHTMARSIKKSLASEFNISSAPLTASTRKTRSLPGSSKDSAAPIHKVMDPGLVKQYRVEMTMRKMLFMQSLLNAQVRQIMEIAGPYSVDAYRNIFRVYNIDKQTVRHASAKLTMYPAQNVNRPGMSLAVRVYARSDLDPDSSVYFKILRHLAYKHPYIIHTLELFFDRNNVYIFQEWATEGNLADFMERSEPLCERKTVFWAKQITQALDFLGDLAIAHRDLSPVHLVVTPQHGSDVWLKLTGFSKSMIYWDIASNDINFCPCLPLECQKKDGANYQPPEVYGDPETEQFDPILADTWSLGAVVYFMLTKQHPFNATESSGDIDEEIKQNIEKHASLSLNCRDFLFAMLRGNANDRMPFDFVGTHRWLKRTRPMVVKRNAQSSSSKLNQSSGIGKRDSDTGKTSSTGIAKSSSTKVASGDGAKSACKMSEKSHSQ